MQSQDFLPPAFLEWATPKLPALAYARWKDAQLPALLDVNFARRLRYYLAEFAKHPFSQPDFVGNLNAGSAYLTAEALRQRAAAFFTSGSILVEGDFNGRNRTLELSGPGLWAASEDARVHELTFLELGIPLTAKVPAAYGQQRKAVIKREFGMLEEAEQRQWQALGEARTMTMARGETAVIAVQDRQASINKWLFFTLLEKLDNSGLGDSMVINWDGYYVGGEDKSLKHFHGQVATHGPLPRWFEASTFINNVLPAWKEFVCEQVHERVSSGLDELPQEVCDDQIPGFRQNLKSFLEEMFILQCGFEDLDKEAFWSEVEAAPYKFVAPERLPNCITFADPIEMEKGDFLVAYAHIRLCWVDRDAVGPELRFVYEADVIEEYITIAHVVRLKAFWDTKKGSSSGLPAPVAASERSSEIESIAADDGHGPAQRLELTAMARCGVDY